MTITELLELVSASYPNDLVGQYHRHPEEAHGDLLAKFIAVELTETFNGHARTPSQLFEARRVINRAAEELKSIVLVLDEELNSLSTQAGAP
jgi:hypothetical protein